MPKKQNQSILGKIGSFLDDMAKAEADSRARYNASAQPIMDMVAAHNAKFPSKPLYLTTTAPNTIRECGVFTVLADCQDPNCFRHYEDKKRAASRKPSTSF